MMVMFPCYVAARRKAWAGDGCVFLSWAPRMGASGSPVVSYYGRSSEATDEDKAAGDWELARRSLHNFREIDWASDA